MSRLDFQKKIISFSFFNMATTNENTKMSGTRRLTGKISGPHRIMGKFIPRPVVVKKGYGGPSAEGAREYNELKREFNFLFKEFTGDRQIIKMRKVTYKTGCLKRACDALYKKSRLWRKTTEASFASMARVGAKPTARFSSVPEVRKPDMSRYQARRDYTRAYKQVREQRQAALELVKAMAARRPRVVRHVKDSVTLTEYKQLREARLSLARERRFLRRHPAKEVVDFPLGCEQEKPAFYLAPAESQSEERTLAYPTSIKQIKRKCFWRYFTTEKWIKNITQVAKGKLPCRIEEPRLGFLKFKLRQVIRAFRNYEDVMSSYDRIIRRANNPVGQMDSDGVEQSSSSIAQQSGNVVIKSAALDDRGEPTQTIRGFENLAVSQEKQIFETLSDRWLPLGSFEWKVASTDKIFNLSLPSAIYRGCPDSQMAQLMYVNRFFRCDLEFKVILNSSPWQTGLLIVDWCYGDSADIERWDNVYAALQRNHVRLNAGSSNNAVLTVPYHHFNAFLSSVSAQGYYGRITARPLNPLMATDKVAQKATLTLFVALKNFKGHGLISRAVGISGKDRNEVQGQMNTVGALCNVGSDVLRTAGKLFNQDKPPLPLQPTCLVPQTVPSFAYTDGIIEPINVLRSDPRGQRPSPYMSDEMFLQHFTRKWGYMRTLEWKFSDGTFTELPKGRFTAAPLTSYDDYDSTITAGPLKKTVLPPVAFITSFASKVRGNLEFRFEVVANSFYTGSLQISIVPLMTRRDKVSITDMQLSATYYIDIQKTSELSVEVPWNWFNAWMRSPSLHHQGNSFAEVIVSVVNPLVGIDGVPTSIPINVYIRGGLNFEITQLHTPIISRIMDHLIPPSDEYLVPYNTETAVYTTYQRNLVGNVGKLATMYIQSGVTDAWLGFKDIEPYQVYNLKRTTNMNREILVNLLDTNKQPRRVLWGVYHSALSTANAKGLVVFTDKDSAYKAAKIWKEKGYGDIDSVAALPGAGYYGDSGWSLMYVGGKWITADNKTGEHMVWFKDIPNPTPEVVVGQMDGQGVSYSLEASAPSTSFGTSVYGESMPDLKGISRRWQLFGSFVGKTCASKYPRNCPYLFKLPVIPMRDLAPEASFDFDNRVREGAIGLLNGCFRFWDGGMRYRLVISHGVPEDTTIYVQHRFDDETGVLEKQAFIIPGPSKAQNAKPLLDTHYPTFVQALSVNPVLTVEVPYMRTEERLLTDCPLGLRPCSNGYLYVWAHGQNSLPIHCEVYYSVADDFQWSVFQGCPYTVDIRTIPDEPAVGQMDDEPWYCYPPGDRPRLEPFFKDKPEESEQPKGDGLLSWLSGTMIPADDRINTSLSAFDNAAGKIAGASEVISKGVEVAAVRLSDSGAAVSANFEKLSDKLQNFVDTISDVPSSLSQAQKDRIERGHMSSFLLDLKGASFDYFTHFVYCVMNPNGKTVAWAVVNLYRNVWGFSLDGLTTVTEAISSLWNRTTRSSQQPQSEEPTGQMEDTEITSLCSVLYCSLCSVLKLTMRPPTNWKNICDGLFMFGDSCRNTSFLSRFIGDNIELFKRVWRKLLSYFSVDSANYKLIAGLEDDRLKSWCIHSTSILNPSVRETIYTNPLWAEKVFELAVAGRALLLVLSKDKTTPPGIIAILNQNLRSLKKLEEDLVNRKVFCGERYEPCCIWVAGKAGTGKTRFLQDISSDLAAQVGRVTAHPYHTITFQQQYFDGFCGQPAILIDDFLTTSPSTDPTAHMYIQMKSSALFNPPYSDVKDKAKLVNFQNLLVTSNFLKVSNMPGIHDETAYNRRRDVLLEFKPRASWTVPKDEMTNEQYEAMEHVDVHFIFDPIKCNDGQLIARVNNESYNSTVKKFVLDKTAKYHKRESSSFVSRCRKKLEAIEQLTAKSETVSDYLEKCAQVFPVRDSIKAHQIPDVHDAVPVSESKGSNFLFETWMRGTVTTEPTIVKSEPEALPPEKPKVIEKILAEEPTTSGNSHVEEAKVLLAAEDTAGCMSLLAKLGKEYDKERAEIIGLMNDFMNKDKVRNPTPPFKVVTPVIVEPPEEKEEEKTLIEEPKGQMDESPIVPLRPYWPQNIGAELLNDVAFCKQKGLTPLSRLANGQLIEPVIRNSAWPFLKQSKGCLHKMVRNVGDYVYDSELGVFVHLLGYGDDLESVPTSFPVGVCYKKNGESIEYNPACLLIEKTERFKFYSRLVQHYLDMTPEAASVWPNLTPPLLKKIKEALPEIVISTVLKSHVRAIEKFSDTGAHVRFLNHLEKMQKTLRAKGIDIDGCILPVESKWKTIPNAVYKGLVKMFKLIALVFRSMAGVLAVITLLGSIGLGATAVYNHGWSAVSDTIVKPIGHLHSSGDFKTMRANRGPRRIATALSKGQGVVPNGENQSHLITGLTEENILKACRDTAVDPSSDGRLRKVVSNVFTLVGMRPVDGDNYITYSVRCIGLRGYEFICLKHYIDHFKEHGVERVAVVHYRGQSVQMFDLKDLDFAWGECGYGIGTFPTLSVQFKDITKLMPSEKFDGHYPYEMYMITVQKDSFEKVLLKCVPLQQPKVIPKNGGQEAWTIVDGFNYSWGGPGRCGSFLFAPGMACPLVGIHTAGVRDRLGYAEMLFRETFSSADDIVVEYVTPQMNYNEDGYVPSGLCNIVGHLDKTKSVHLPTQTKIQLSEVAGVFPVKTEPAPLIRGDPRLPPGCDPFDEGIMKRCDQPKEFPSDLLALAFEDYAAIIKIRVLPVKQPGALSIKEAVEGLTLPGYEPMEMSTSEGYPFVLKRPSRATDKSWLFQFEAYPDGRRKLIGMNEDLLNTLKRKEEMRLRGLVPATYFTACLKDARIPIEKVGLPGKTRVFEMSPVDLTIPQRQYFLDFYASYQASRLRAEHTIGINPDGPDWTELAEYLTSFSPFILTADYSGYGPRLLQSVQLRAYMTEIQWYEKYLEEAGVAEEEMERQFKIRYTMCFEMLHPLNVLKDCVCYFNTGMPSGNAGTVIKNSECNSLYIRVMYLFLARKYKPEYADMYWFHKLIRMVSNGDDLIIAVKPEAIEWFNNRTLIEGFAKFDIKMTDALKSGNVREYCSIEEATYLKRGFLKHPSRSGQWLAPLEESSITDTANWVWRSINHRDASLVNSEMSARLAYTRGPQYYNSIVERLVACWAGLGVEFRAPSWKSLDSHVWDGTEGPRFSF